MPKNHYNFVQFHRICEQVHNRWADISAGFPTADQIAHRIANITGEPCNASNVPTILKACRKTLPRKVAAATNHTQVLANALQHIATITGVPLPQEFTETFPNT